MSAVLPLKESSRELIVEVARALDPYFPDITAAWREKITEEFHFEARAVAALERIKIATACSYLCHGDLQGFIENLVYTGTRLAKLKVDTRLVAFSLDIYQSRCEPYLGSLFGERRAEAIAALETLNSATFVTVCGAYFDTKTNESSALLSILDAELAAPTVTVLLERVLRISTTIFKARMGVVLLREIDSDLLRVKASAGLDEEGEFQEDFAVQTGQGFSGAIAQSGEPALSLDAGHDDPSLNPAWRRKAKTLWGMPLKKTDSTVIGVLLLGFDRPYEWLPTERELMRAIADRSALAIDRAHIAETLREREARIAELSGHLLRAQEEERQRISRELHDETGQALMVIRLYLGMLEQTVPQRTPRARIRETVAVVDRTIEGIRRIIGRLSPLVLQELGLVAAIRKEAKDLLKNAGVRVRVNVAENVGRLDAETEIALYRIVQEALHNVAKHAQAHSVNIQLSREEETVKLTVEDDGVGMPAKSNNSRGHSFGLAGIKERVKSMKGVVRVQSAKGKGTRLEVSVPSFAATAVEATATVAVTPLGSRVH
ncbi:MAG TPA: GAF domain-containing sensor histidine kinase [Terriglobales bacterium]|nr:GAF domain-containing sensor histidine kinase [Terriglobales bacterium]